MTCDLSLNEPDSSTSFKKPKNKHPEYINLKDIKINDIPSYNIENLEIPNLKRQSHVLETANDIMDVLKTKHYI